MKSSFTEERVNALVEKIGILIPTHFFKGTARIAGKNIARDITIDRKRTRF